MYMYICMYKYTYTSICINIYMYIYICICIRTYICIYTSMHIHIDLLSVYLPIHIYIYIYIHMCVCVSCLCRRWRLYRQRASTWWVRARLDAACVRGTIMLQVDSIVCAAFVHVTVKCVHVCLLPPPKLDLLRHTAAHTAKYTARHTCNTHCNTRCQPQLTTNWIYWDTMYHTLQDALHHTLSAIFAYWTGSVGTH